MTEELVEDHLNYIPSFIRNETDLLPDSADGNGLIIQNLYIPEEVLIQILSYIDSDKLLHYSLVCRKWNNLIKSYPLWSLKYKQKYKCKAKNLPWYVYYCILSSNYFDTNLLKNGNGQDGFQNWQFVCNGGDQCCIEDPPNGSDNLPLNVPEFDGYTSCFATSFGDCHKKQLISLGQNKLFHYVLNSYKPHIYLSEWIAGRFDCGCIYVMRCGFIGEKVSQEFYKPCAMQHIVQWFGEAWEKIEMFITEYPEDIESLVFENIGRDTQFWKGHFGSKMAGGVVKFLSASIEPLPEDEHGNLIPRTFSDIKYICNGLPENEKQIFRHLMVYNNEMEEEHVFFRIHLRAD